jgi:N-acetyl-anhydromuramyl-L-alanine amidase AmpD
MAEEEETGNELPPEAKKDPSVPLIDWKLLAQFVAQHFKEKHLIEMTPDEADAARRRAYQALREGVRAKGYTLPESDEDLFFLLRSVLK